MISSDLAFSSSRPLNFQRTWSGRAGAILMAGAFFGAADFSTDAFLTGAALGAADLLAGAFLAGDCFITRAVVGV